jgi:hypothetical protein
VYGPNTGSTYDLWPEPQTATTLSLDIVEEPGRVQNHLLQAKPSLIGSATMATVNHGTQLFTSASAEFDVWVNATLVNASDNVSIFRWAAIDGDYDHVVALYFRTGQAWLRAESSTIEYKLSKLPRTDGKPTHVRVQITRGEHCSADVFLDGEMVAHAPEGECVTENNAYVEYGLFMRDARSGAMSAYFDNITFTRK